jgi:hypothetical protein
MAAGGRTGSNRFVPIRAALDWSAAPDPRKSVLPCAGSWPLVCRIPGGRIGAEKCFAPSRGCVARFSCCQTRLPARFGPLQQHYPARISGPYFGEHIQRGLPACLSHNAARACGVIHPWTVPSPVDVSGLRCSNKRLKHTATSASYAPIEPGTCTGVSGVPPATSMLLGRSGKPDRRDSLAGLLIYPPIIPGRWPRWCTPLARRPDFPARRAISAFSPLPRR